MRVETEALKRECVKYRAIKNTQLQLRAHGEHDRVSRCSCLAKYEILSAWSGFGALWCHLPPIFRSAFAGSSILGLVSGVQILGDCEEVGTKLYEQSILNIAERPNATKA